MDYLKATSSMIKCCDVNNSGTITTIDYTIIQNIINGITANTKTVSGNIEINSQDPKHCISIYNNGNKVVSLGAGGINADIANVKNLFCGYQVGSSVNNYTGVMINGYTGEIFCQNNGPANTTTINPSVITSPKFKVLDEGYVMYGTTNDDYHCIYSNGQLTFYVNNTNVGTLSDKRLKKEIKNIDKDFINAIKEIETKQFKVVNRNGLISFGIMAQDLIEIFKKYNKNPFDYEIVQETKYKDNEDKIYYAINYEQFLILKTKAQELEIKELQEKDKQKDKIINDLISRIEKLEKGE